MKKGNTVVIGTAHSKLVLGKGSPDGKFKEYKYSREVCKAVQAALQDLGYTAIIDIEDESIDVKKELALRCRIVNELHNTYKNCIYVSIHVNAAASDNKWHEATGWEVYTTPGKTKSDALATCLYNAAKNNFKNMKLRADNSDGDPDKEAHLYVLKNTNCPAVLTENFFQDNKKDVEYLLSDEGFHAVVRTHVEGIVKYIEDNQ